jgi:hypothetical protein
MRIFELRKLDAWADGDNDWIVNDSWAVQDVEIPEAIFDMAISDKWTEQAVFLKWLVEENLFEKGVLKYHTQFWNCDPQEIQLCHPEDDRPEFTFIEIEEGKND